MSSNEWPGLVYVLCFDPPRSIASVSRDYPHDPDSNGGEATVGRTTGRVFGFRSLPIRHYVGWTSHHDPYTRLRWHGLGPPFREHLVETFTGTLADEQRTKQSGMCRRCGGSLTPGDS